jgi:hypothetical protein
MSKKLVAMYPIATADKTSTGSKVRATMIWPANVNSVTATTDASGVVFNRIVSSLASAGRLIPVA